MRCFKYACFIMTVLAPVVVRAQSAPVSLELGGYMKWYAAAGYVKAKENKADYNRFDIMGDAEIYFSGESVLCEDEKYKIGVMAQLKTGTESTDSDDSGEYALYADTKEGRIWDEVYALFDASFGRFFLGNVKNVAYQMAVTAPTISVLGVEESEFTRLSGSVPMTTLPVYDDVGTKISYISPTIGGVTAGVSYMPSNNTNGHDASVLKSGTLDFAVISSLLYDKETAHGFFSFSFAVAQYKPRIGRSGKNFSAGFQIAEGNHTLGASYMKSLNGDLDNGANGAVHGGKSQTLNIGWTYDLGLAAAGVNYIVQTGEDKYGNLRRSMMQTSFKYRLASGVDAFCDMAYINDNTTQNRRNTFGSAVGIDLSF